jgi:hypothetical protein
VRVFRYKPRDRWTPADKIGFGNVTPGETYEVDDAQASLLEHDPDFVEVNESLDGLLKAQLIDLANAEGVDLTDANTVPEIKAAIVAHRTAEPDPPGDSEHDDDTSGPDPDSTGAEHGAQTPPAGEETA